MDSAQHRHGLLVLACLPQIPAEAGLRVQCVRVLGTEHNPPTLQHVLVDIAGEQLAADTGPLADAVWMKNNLARAKMALPNGYCALPLQQKCEFANACLTCPVFVTTPKFLPQHRRQLERTQVLIAQADRNGHQRLAEMNHTVEKSLLAIIDGLTTSGCRFSGGKSRACGGKGGSNAC